MMRKDLRKSGLYAVSEKHFRMYAALPIKQFEELYEIWINESESTGVRIMALRDMLRQRSYGNKDNPCVHFKVEGGSERLFCMNGNDSRSNLYHELKNRPLLVREMQEELKYAIGHDIVARTFSQDVFIAELIELILAAGENNVADSDLMEYHPMNRESTKFTEQVYHMTKIIFSDRYEPDWLKIQCWDMLHYAMIDDGANQEYPEDQKVALEAINKLIVDLADCDDDRFRAVEYILKVVNADSRNQIELDTETLLKFLPRMRNVNLALDLALRSLADRSLT